MPTTSKRRIDDDGRECSRCGDYKPWDQFGPKSNGIRGREPRCKPCMVVKTTGYLAADSEARKRHNERVLAYQKTPGGRDTSRRARLKHRYGITEDQYDFLLAQQDYACYLCGLGEAVPHHATGKLMRLGVEHSHACTSGHDPEKACPACIRGLTCYNCNHMVAKAERSPRLAARFADYLERRPLLVSG
jgi:hypothetical protein